MTTSIKSDWPLHSPLRSALLDCSPLRATKKLVLVHNSQWCKTEMRTAFDDTNVEREFSKKYILTTVGREHALRLPLRLYTRATVCV